MKLKTLFAVGAAVLLAGCLGDATGTSTITIPALQPLASGVQIVTTENGLQYADITVGTGNLAQNGSSVAVHYTLWLENGKGIDTSLSGSPISFQIGGGNLLKGFEQGVIGMRVGGTRRLIIPPALGYGDVDVKDANGNVVIPANSTLIFDVQLVAVAN